MTVLKPDCAAVRAIVTPVAAQPCACFPGVCRGGQVINGRTLTGAVCQQHDTGPMETSEREARELSPAEVAALVSPAQEPPGRALTRQTMLGYFRPPESSYPMGEGWAVSVSRWGERILTIEHQALSGKSELTDDDQRVILGCAEHLSAFVGGGLTQARHSDFLGEPAASTPAVQEAHSTRALGTGVKFTPTKIGRISTRLK